MSEATFQRKIIKKLESDGWYVIKLIKTNKNGIPDLLALKSNEIPYFIEVKSVNGKCSALQEYRIEEIKEFGFKAVVMYEPAR